MVCLLKPIKFGFIAHSVYTCKIGVPFLRYICVVPKMFLYFTISKREVTMATIVKMTRTPVGSLTRNVTLQKTNAVVNLDLRGMDVSVVSYCDCM